MNDKSSVKLSQNQGIYLLLSLLSLVCLLQILLTAPQAVSPIKVSGVGGVPTAKGKGNTTNYIKQENLPSISIIVASSGRPFLKQTLESLLRQSDPYWNAIVMIDGLVTEEQPVKDQRIVYRFMDFDTKFNKVSPEQYNRYDVSQVRNAAIEHSNSDWIGFVDDDDCLSSSYVQMIRYKILRNPYLDAIVYYSVDWTVRNGDSNPMPPLGVSEIERGLIGNTFAMKKSLFDKGFRFKGKEDEGFYLLDSMRKNGKRIEIVDQILYFSKRANLEYIQQLVDIQRSSKSWF